MELLKELINNCNNPKTFCGKTINLFYKVATMKPKKK